MPRDQFTLNTSNLLPKPDDLMDLDASQRDVLHAKIALEIRRRKQSALEKAHGYTDPVEWLETNFWEPTGVNLRNMDYSRSRLIRFADFQKRITRHVLTLNPHTGRFPYRTIIYSAPKKSGKSTWGAAFVAYFAKFVEAPNEIFILANTREQSKDRVFSFAIPTLKKLGAKNEGNYLYYLPNGTAIRANTSDPEQEAGGSYGLTVWDELWAYKGERMRLLFDELMPVATRNNSMRLVVTYAGFEDRSELLLSIYHKIFKNTQETELAVGARAVPELADIVTTDSEGAVIPCCYEVPEMGLFYFNDHEQRMPWQQGESGQALRRETEGLLTPENVFRLMENRWQATENRLVDPEILRASFTSIPPIQPMTFAIDASMRHDNTALCGTFPIRDLSGAPDKGSRYVTGAAHAWAPKGDNIDLKATVMSKLLEYWKKGLIMRRPAEPGEKLRVEKERLIPIDVWYDPFQMHQIAMDMAHDHKLLMREFPQGKERLLADTFLKQQYEAHNIDNLDSPELLSHLEAARAEMQMDADESRIRIVKANSLHAKPIDLAVAQSMSIWRCSKRRGGRIMGISQGKTKGWQR